MRRLRFRIAREIGGMTVAELEHRLYADEEIEWLAIFQIEAAELQAARTGKPVPWAPIASAKQQNAALRAWIDRAVKPPKRKR